MRLRTAGQKAKTQRAERRGKRAEKIAGRSAGEGGGLGGSRGVTFHPPALERIKNFRLFDSLGVK